MYTLIVGLLAATAAVILTSQNQNAKRAAEQGQILPPISHEELVRDYERRAKAAVNEYSGLEVKGNFTAGEIQKVKDDLLGLKVPAEFKDLHVQLVLGLTKIEDSLAAGDAKIQAEGQKKIEQAKAAYAWLE